MLKEKRYVSMSTYQKMTGLSYKTVKHLIETSQLKTIKTEAGNYRIDVVSNNSAKAEIELKKEISNLKDALRSTETMVKALCKHLNATV